MNQFKPLANLAAAAIIAAFSHLPIAEVPRAAPEPCGFSRALRTIQLAELVKRRSSSRTQMDVPEQNFRQRGNVARH